MHWVKQVKVLRSHDGILTFSVTSYVDDNPCEVIIDYNVKESSVRSGSIAGAMMLGAVAPGKSKTWKVKS